MVKQLLLSALICTAVSLKSQSKYQYFDGNDTIVHETITIEYSDVPEDVWYVGPPEKLKFNAPYSEPNALYTSKKGGYAPNNISSFTMRYDVNSYGYGILALQWAQKLDYEASAESGFKDGGIIEYSTDEGSTWSNVFQNPYVYNFYGYNQANAVRLSNGEYGFSGTDTTWRDIWLCFDQSFLFEFESVLFRFTHTSDASASYHEGWMLDNFQMHLTMVHTITETEQSEYLNFTPNPSSGVVNIKAQKRNDFHIIQSMVLHDKDGRVVQKFGKSPTKFQIDISHHPAGTYYLKVVTNLKTETHKIVLVND